MDLHEDVKLENTQVISDHSIKKVAQDKFAHSTFVNWLVKTLDSSCRPLNIGLFGKWGVGKTGILQMFEESISLSYSAKYDYLYIDCWKLSPQSLREQILIQLDGLYGGKKNDEIKNRLYNIIQKSQILPANEKWRQKLIRLSKLSIPYFLMAAGFIGIGALVDYYYPAKNLLPLIGSLFLIPLIADLSKRLAQNSSSIFGSVKQVIPPIQSPIEFENLFNEILQNKKSGKKLVISLDNLDRCEGNLVIEMISTVKSFMEHEDVFFIVPCDDEAIIEHLQKLRNFEEDNARDFLRKFFQVSVVIPPFLKDDIIKYTDDLVKEYKIPVSEGVKYILSVAVIDNPRRIKQYLNNFVANYRLAVEREGKEIPDGTITSHTEFLAKILVLRDQFPKFFKRLLEEENLLSYVEAHFSGQPLANYSTGQLETVLEEDKKLENFLRITRHITVDNINPFIRFGQEPYEKIQEYPQLRNAVRLNNKDAVLEILGKSKGEEDRVVNTILNIVKEDMKMRRHEFAFNDLSILLTIVDKIEPKLKKDIIETFGMSASAKYHLDKIHYFDREKVFSFLREMDKRYRDSLLEKYCEVLPRLSDFDQKLLDNILLHHDILSPKAREQFGASFQEFYNRDPKLASELIQEKFSNSEDLTKLIDINTVGRIVDSIAEGNMHDDNKARVACYFILKSRATPKIKNNFMDRLLKILPPAPKGKIDAATQFVFDNLSKLEDEDITEEGTTIILDKLGSYENAIGDAMVKVEYLEPMIKNLHKLPKKEIDEFVMSKLINYMTWPSPPIDKLIGIINKSRLKIIEYPDVYAAMLNRMKTDFPSSVISYLIQNSSTEQKHRISTVIITNLTPGNDALINNTLNLISDNFKGLSEHAGEICNNIIHVSKKFELPLRKRFFETLVKIFSSCKSDLKLLVTNELMDLISQGDHKRSFGLEYLKQIWMNVDDKNKKEILKQTILIFNSKNDINVNDKNLLDIIIDNQGVIEKNDMRTFISFLKTQIVTAKPEPTKELALEYLSKLENLLEEVDEIIEAVEKLIESKNDNIVTLATLINKKFKK